MGCGASSAKGGTDTPAPAGDSPAPGGDAPVAKAPAASSTPAASAPAPGGDAPAPGGGAAVASVPATDPAPSAKPTNMPPKRAALIVIDGWGERDEEYGNAIKQASTPVMDGFKTEAQYAVIEASGLAVGLPEGTMGNSEVGHLTIGAGAVE